MLPTVSSPLPGYITTAQAAAHAGRSQPHIALLLRRNILRGMKVAPRLWLVERASLDQYMATEHKPGPKPKEPPAS